MNPTPTSTPTTAATDDDLARSAREVIGVEAEAIHALGTHVNGSFSQACRQILACRGRVVVTGMGKSGHVARKIAATLASTGTPAFFVHPAEASHGDLGMIQPEDLVMALSHSGETDELLLILPLIKRQGIVLIALTGNPSSSLARQADVHIDVSVAAEACPLGLAPTTSTTAALVMGDALSVALLKARGFTSEDFARSHPAGHLGRQLLLRIADIMHAGASIPQVHESASLSEALMEVTHKRLGITAVVDANGELAGVFTDGDLRRAIDDNKVNLRTSPIRDFMARNPKTIAPDRLAIEAAQTMEKYRIHALLVVDDRHHVVGALNIHDLLQARVV